MHCYFVFLNKYYHLSRHKEKQPIHLLLVMQCSIASCFTLVLVLKLSWDFIFNHSLFLQHNSFYSFISQHHSKMFVSQAEVTQSVQKDRDRILGLIPHNLCFAITWFQPGKLQGLYNRKRRCPTTWAESSQGCNLKQCRYSHTRGLHTAGIPTWVKFLRTGRWDNGASIPHH